MCVGLYNNNMKGAKKFTRKFGVFVMLNVFCCFLVYSNLPDKTVRKIPPGFKNVYARYDLSKKNECDYNCQTQVQQYRKDTLTEVCAEMGRHSPYGEKQLHAYDVMRLHLDHIYVIDSMQLMFCAIPKAGSSNWKRVILALTGAIDDVKSIHQYNIHNTIAAKGTLLSDYSFRDVLHRVRNYKKFVFVRDPFVRLLSAYRNKLERAASPFRRKFGPRIKKTWLAKLRGISRFNVSFTEFADYLRNQRNTLMTGPEEHWREMYRLCEPCSIGYDFIGKMESIDRDAQYVFDNVINVTENSKIYFMNSSANIHVTGSSDETIFDKYYHSLPDATIQGLLQRYKPDFRLFGYDVPVVSKPNYTKR
ncbi:Carbohydrate sulfotransferase 14 [Apostichopus japonicus]|uniref:Carbohydrate sulfotransferase n=1 Tax=Stichopus japonicus TaxID=307972 RepID=A0A2G8KRI0_STIJA|nr:Carbohydrate sulfotransferase 14 [Apostichopus japonicus]